MPHHYGSFPDFIRIGPNEIPVKVTPKIDHKKSRGTYAGVGGGISLKKSLDTPLEAIEVALHEILHGVWDLWHFDRFKGDEEKTITGLASWMATVFVDNPALLKWLIEQAIEARR